MAKEGYKKIKFGPLKVLIPNDWRTKKLKDLIEYKNGYAFSSSNYSEDGKIVFRMSNIDRSGRINVNENNIKYCNRKTFDELVSYQLKKNDLVLCMTDMNSDLIILGRTGVIDENNIYILNQRVGRVRIKKKKELYFKYLHYFTNSKSYLDYIKATATGSAQYNTSTKTIKNTVVPLPPLAEQKKITTILSSVDNAIEKTDEIINKAKEVKKGLMQDLFTKGIGHNEFKDTQFGKIPKIWDIEALNKIGKILGGNTPRRNNSKYWGGNIPWLTPSQLTGKTINIIYDTDEYITDEGFKNSSVKLLPIGSVLLTSRATIGETVINKVPITTNQGFANIICDDEYLLNYYLLYLLRYMTPRLKALAGGSTFLEISRTSVRSLNIPVPPLEEQNKIAKILLSIDNKIQKEKENKEKLEKLKKGLMQKLLTGEIRVKVDTGA